MKMKILIIGGSGVLGYNLIKFLKKDYNISYTYLKNKIDEPNEYKLDFTDKTKTVETISKINPNIIIHCAALTNVDECEENKLKAYSVNVEGTKNIIEAAKKNNTKFVYVSTSAVFSGKKSEYFEGDEVDPISIYGETKAEAEKIVEKSGLEYIILRTDQPYFWFEKWQHTNSVMRVIDTLKLGKTMYEVTNWENTPTYVPDFVKATKKLLDLNKNGIYHLVGSDFINRYDWALLTAKIFDLDQSKIQRINSNQINVKAIRSNVKLNNQKITFETKMKFLGVKEGLKNMKKFYLNKE